MILDAPAAEQQLKEEEINKLKKLLQSAPETEAKTEKEELGEYSDGVQKRIAKLTRKMREAERQKEEAITYAQTVAEHANRLKTRFE